MRQPQGLVLTIVGALKRRLRSIALATKWLRNLTQGGGIVDVRTEGDYRQIRMTKYSRRVIEFPQRDDVVPHWADERGGRVDWLPGICFS